MFTEEIFISDIPAHLEFNISRTKLKTAEIVIVICRASPIESVFHEKELSHGILNLE